MGMFYSSLLYDSVTTQQGIEVWSGYGFVVSCVVLEIVLRQHGIVSMSHVCVRIGEGFKGTFSGVVRAISKIESVSFPVFFDGL